MYEDLFVVSNDDESRVFLLTAMRDGTVKAERIRSAADTRLRSKQSFAVIRVESFLLTDGEIEALERMSYEPERMVDGIGEAYVLRPRIASRLGGIDEFFAALRDVTEDVLLTPHLGSPSPDWSIVHSGRKGEQDE
jgi:hypothetical protein